MSALVKKLKISIELVLACTKMPTNAPSDRIIIDWAVRTRFKPKRTWMEENEKNLELLNLMEDMTLR